LFPPNFERLAFYTNWRIPPAIESVQTDGGAFNVSEGNHSLNLVAAYGLRSRINPFVTVSGDYRDIDIVSGFNPTGSDKKAWIKIGFDNFDLLTPTNSFNRLAGVNNPKAIVSLCTQ
jgi:hypothetical protein